MELTTRIFRDLAVLANWAFQTAGCEPGAYKLAEVATNIGGKFNLDIYALQTSSLPDCATWQDESEYIVKLSYNGGMQVYTFYIYNVFNLLKRFKRIAAEDITAKEKRELCTMIKDDRDEILSNTLRAKVLQYKSDGNTLIEKWETLEKLVDGVYYTKNRDNWDNVRYAFIFEDNGIFWYSLRAATENQFNNPKERERIIDLRKNFRAYVKETAQNNGFIRSMEIEVFKRLGEDTAPLYASREAYLKNREEEERKRAEEAERRERERKEAEERRKAELLADGKEKLLNGEKITVEQIELIAGAVGYKINIRTLGTMRKKLVSMSYSEANGWDYSYYSGKNTSDRNFKGAMDALRAIYIILKSEECERESAQGTECTAEISQSEQSEQATETPRISTETADTAISESWDNAVIAMIDALTDYLRTRGIYPPQSQETPQNVCERIAIPHRKRQEYLQHSGLWRHNTFRRLRVRRCFAVSRVVGWVNGENAAERKETGNFTRWHGCTYRQFTRGSTIRQHLRVFLYVFFL